MTDFQFFMPIAKVDKERRTVSGYASTPTKDGDGEIVTLDAIKTALPGYMDYGNIREMHALKAVGSALEANMDKRGLYLTAYIADDEAWKKCIPAPLEGGLFAPAVYKGFSIGGRKLAKTGNKITSIEMTEISIVDRPSNPDCRIDIAKSAKAMAEGNGGYLLKVKKVRSPEDRAIAKLAKVVGDLSKRNKNPSPNDDSEQNNKAADVEDVCKQHGAKACTKCAAAKAAGKSPCEAHGHFDCDKCVSKREFTSDERSSDASSGAALPDGSYPIENKSDLANAIQAYGRAKDKAKAKAHIISRAKALGAENSLPESWGKSKEKKAKKLAKAKLAAAFGIRNNDSFLLLRKSEPALHVEDDPFVLRKSMRTVGSMSYSFDSLREAQRSLLMEAKREGGDMKDKALGKRLGDIAKQLADVISEKASHEGIEATDLSDADDSYLTSMLGEDFDMTKTAGGEEYHSGDPLADAMNALMKRAAMPTRMQRMAMAKADIDKSRKACKAARETIEEVHKMLKASYIAKAAKKDKPKDDDADDFDSAEAMGKLQKAFGDINKARYMAKAAGAQIEKAAARSGQRGQEANDPEAGFFEVPPGVTDLSSAAMAGAAPGTKAGGSQPPMYSGEGGVYPGKAAASGDLRKYIKNGAISADVAELLLQKAASDGELEVLRRMPANLGRGQRPYAFDLTAVAGNTHTSTSGANLNKALFNGINTADFQSDDERVRSAATAKAAGNFILSGEFGKSVFDTEFRGAAGSAR